MSPLINEGTDLALRFGSSGGQTFVQSSSPLTRLNYFDGMLVRADKLRREQDYVRQLVQYSNQGLGAGIVYGIDTTLDSQGRLAIGPGLAMDSVGRTLLVQSTAAFDIAALIEATRRIAVSARIARTPLSTFGAGAEFSDCVDLTAPPGGELGQGVALYLVCIGHAESLCGTDDVYGRLCEEACVTATDRPYIVEGVIVRALPLTLRTPLARSRVVTLDNRHLRSLVASAFFEDERHVVASLISRAGLALDAWCLGADTASVGCVPLGVIARSGTKTLYLDAWTARRERIEAPARRYWAWRMAMRPWDVYLAQILQFQCQLHEVLGVGPDQGSPPDPCEPQRKVLDEAAVYLREIDQSYARHIDALAKLGSLPENMTTDDVVFRLQGGATDLASLRERISGALTIMISGARERLLINGGIVELPSAGYLPVVPGTVSVNSQVRRLMGEGVDLRFCVVRPDFVAHALEEAQHMERISLLVGLDDPQAKPQVDIFVPNGELITAEQPELAGFDTQMRVNQVAIAATVASASAARTAARTAARRVVSTSLTTTDDRTKPLTLHGAGRAERLSTGGGAFYFAGAQESTAFEEIGQLAEGIRHFALGSAKTRADLFKRAAGAPSMPEETTPAPAPDDAMVSRYVMRASVARLRDSSAGLMEVAPAAIESAPAAVSISATMRSDRDPYAMQVGDTTTMIFEVFLTSQRQVETGTELHVLLRVRAVGTFTATQAAVDTTAGRRTIGHFSGTVTTQKLEDSTDGTNHSTSLDVEARLTRSGTPSSGKLDAVLTGTRMMLRAEATWSGQPLTATLKLSFGVNASQKTESGEVVRATLAETQLVELFNATAVANDHALEQGNALRMLSSSAIDLIGQELNRANQGGTAFVDAAQRALFPPPPPPVDDLTVRPTLDWVLFQRRRVKRCAVEVAPPVSPTRRYQVYHLPAANDAEVRFARAALRTPDGILKFRFQRVDVVEFAGGLPTLLSPGDVLLRDWNTVHPGNRLIYGAIATPITTDTPPLESARLSRVVQSVASLSPVDPNNALSGFETLPVVPPPLAVPGTDGIIFLITENLVITTCQDVYRVVETERTLALIAKNDLVSLIKFDGVKHIASVEFNEANTNPIAASLTELKKNWSDAGNSAPTSALVYPKPNDTTSGDPNTRVSRARTIADAIGGTANTIVGTRVPAAWPAGPTCPVVTVVTVRTIRTMRVVAIAERTDVSPEARIPLHDDVLAYNANVLQKDTAFDAVVHALQTDIVQPNLLRQVVGATLVTKGAPDADAMPRLKAVVAAFDTVNPRILDAGHLAAAPATRAATNAETAMFDENGRKVDDLLVLTVHQFVIG